MVLSAHVEQVSIQTGNGAFDGVLWLPEDPVGIVLLADGRSGCRVKPPIDYVGTVLRNARLGTFWVDLSLPSGTEAGGDESALIAGHLASACEWLGEHHAACDMPLGLLGAGACVPPVLRLASHVGSRVFAVVVRGGRPDLAAGISLPRINAPTLLIAGSLDDRGVATNRTVYAGLRCKKRLEIIPGATHSFEEPGSLEVVARLARGWFLQNVRVRHV